MRGLLPLVVDGGEWCATSLSWKRAVNARKASSVSVDPAGNGLVEVC